MRNARYAIDRRRRETDRGAVRELLGRLALIALGLLLAVVVLEATLQLGAACLRATGRRPTIGAATGERHVLSLGDSNTYGLNLAREEAYPQQLARLWNASHRDAPIEVLNMGYPGNNSSQLVRHLREMLVAAQPRVLTVMIGVNDYWTLPVPLDDGAGSGSVLWRHSRVYRLAYMLTRIGHPTDVEVVAEMPRADGVARRTVRYGWMEISEVRAPAWFHHSDTWKDSLAQNIGTIAAAAKSAGVPLVLLTYPSSRDYYGVADAVIRQAAADTGTPLVDVAAHFAGLCPEGDCPEILFPDEHPTAKGSAITAQLLADALPGTGLDR